MAMLVKAIQDYYPEDVSYCYGCGSRNEHGHQLKSYWDGEVAVAHFTPKPWHLAFPGYVYGGLIASLIDCHGVGTAAAAKYRAEGRAMDTEPPVRFVTASLKVDYLAPTPMDEELELRAEVLEVSEKKAVLDVTLSAAGQVCARGKVIAVLMPEQMLPS